MSHKDSDPISNRSRNRHFSELVEVDLRRRQLLVGGFGASSLAFFSTPSLAHFDRFRKDSAPTFTPIETDVLFEDEVRRQ